MWKGLLTFICLMTIIYHVNLHAQEIVEITPTLHLKNDETMGQLFVEVSDPTTVKQAFVEISPPTGDPQDSHLLELKQKGNTGRFELDYEGFTECGQYRLVHTVFYEDGAISPYQGSTATVYKCGGVLPDFELKSPANGAETFATVTFSWEAPDNQSGIPITYTLLIAKDNQFQEIIHQQREIQSTIAKVIEGLEDLERYYWKVEAVNENGDSSTSATRFFNTNDPSAPPGCIDVQVIDAIEKNPINQQINFHFEPARTHTHYDQENPALGHYIRCADPAPTPYHIIMSALGYQSMPFEWMNHSNEFNSGVRSSNNYEAGEKIIFELQPLSPPPPPLPHSRLINMSTLAIIGGKAGSISSGLITSGADKQTLLIRGFGVDTQVNPTLVVKEYPSGNQVAQNDDCGNTPRYSEILELPEHLHLPKVTDACLLLDLPTGGYTITIDSPNEGSGLLGIDSINTSELDSKLINISNFASYGEKISSGFIFQGNGNQTVMIRGFKVDPNIDPHLVVNKYPSGEEVAHNDNCIEAPRQDEIVQLPKHLGVNEPSIEACLLLDLPQGAYTVTLSPIGKGGVLGVDVIE